VLSQHLLAAMLITLSGGIFVLAWIDSKKDLLIRNISIIVVGLQSWMSLEMMLNFDPAIAGMQFAERIRWLPLFTQEYFFGIDGINLPFVCITNLLVVCILIITWHQTERKKSFNILLLLADIGFVGLFASNNLLLWYSFYAISIFTVYLLVGLWCPNDSSGNRIALAGVISLALVLLGLLLLVFESRIPSLDISELGNGAKLPLSSQIVITSILSLGFFILIPIFPFHSWLIDLIDRLPLSLLVLVFGVFTKMGAFGIFRILLPILPNTMPIFSYIYTVWGICGFLYFMLCGLGSTNPKLSLGFMMTGLASTFLIGMGVFIGYSERVHTGLNGLIGSYLQLVSQALLAPALFIAISGQKVGTPVSDSGRSHYVTPALISYSFLALIGIPGTLSFVTIIYLILGILHNTLTITIACFYVLGLILSMVIVLRFFKIFIFTKENRLELSFTERISLSILSLTLLLPGLFPGHLIGIFQHKLQDILAIITATVK